MDFIHRDAASVVIHKVPILLLLVAALFSLPFLAFSLSQIVRGTNADGKYFCLFLGLVMLWVFLEFVARRERIEIDLTGRTFTRQVSGVFRHRRDTVDLKTVERVEVESKRESTGTKIVPRQYVYLSGSRGRLLVNEPSQISIDHRKFARLLAEITGLPLEEITPETRAKKAEDAAPTNASPPPHGEWHYPSPDGRYSFLINPWEALATQWVESPTLKELATNETILRFRDGNWSLDSAAWTSETVVELTLRKYPGDHHPPDFRARVDCARRRAVLADGGEVGLDELEPSLDKLCSAARRG